MEKRAICVLIPNWAASGFQVNPNPLGMARSLRQELRWGGNRCYTHSPAHAFSRPKDRRNGLPGIALTNNPRGGTASKKSEWEKVS